jgi:integrase
MPNAVRPFTRLRDRKRLAPTPEDAKNMALPQPNDLIFPNSYHELFNIVLDEQGLKFDREGQRRTLYSLRHTYICFRLMEGADIYQIAKNCRTSVEMIEKYYASHIQNSLDASAINVFKSRKVLDDEDEDDEAGNQKPVKKQKPKAKTPVKPAKKFRKMQF